MQWFSKRFLSENNGLDAFRFSSKIRKYLVYNKQIMQDDDLSEEEEDEDVDSDPGEENGAKPRKRGKSRKKRRKKS